MDDSKGQIVRAWRSQTADKKGGTPKDAPSGSQPEGGIND